MGNYKDIEEINKEIEEELLQFKESEGELKEKKQFLSLKFVGTFMIVSFMLFSIFRVFI
ncbi:MULTISPECIES: hypothetical protein [Mammaliicoccus]|uniref:hypothetical protein n=1 Tax=Mammaliicoccus TaxID=2803850 RepID=UPI0018E945DD|nr:MULTISPECIES: hypothetical protein [Mammaliicoccus]MEB7779939.1 hypothetical protein [Mammaliicoccus fleurettii]